MFFSWNIFNIVYCVFHIFISPGGKFKRKANINDLESESLCNKMSGTDYEFCSEVKNLLIYWNQLSKSVAPFYTTGIRVEMTFPVFLNYCRGLSSPWWWFLSCLSVHPTRILRDESFTAQRRSRVRPLGGAVAHRNWTGVGQSASSGDGSDGVSGDCGCRCKLFTFDGGNVSLSHA